MQIYKLTPAGLFAGESYDYAFFPPPAETTAVPPPDFLAGHARKFDAHIQAWLQVPLSEVVFVDTRTLEEVKIAKLTELTTAFITAEATGFVRSSLGWDIDATERANRDVSGLIVSMSQAGAPETTFFCDHTNQMHPVTLDNLRTMQLEIIAHGQALYAQKWAARTAIESAETVDAVREVGISFTPPPDAVEATA